MLTVRKIIENILEQVWSNAKGRVTTKSEFIVILCTAFTRLRGQFHQHLMSSFYAQRSQQRKKYSQAICLFCIFGTYVCKSCLQNVDKIHTRFLTPTLVTWKYFPFYLAYGGEYLPIVLYFFNCKEAWHILVKERLCDI